MCACFSFICQIHLLPSASVAVYRWLWREKQNPGWVNHPVRNQKSPNRMGGVGRGERCELLNTHTVLGWSGFKSKSIVMAQTSPCSVLHKFSSVDSWVFPQLQKQRNWVGHSKVSNVHWGLWKEIIAQNSSNFQGPHSKDTLLCKTYWDTDE